MKLLAEKQSFIITQDKDLIKRMGVINVNLYANALAAIIYPCREIANCCSEARDLCSYPILQNFTFCNTQRYNRRYTNKLCTEKIELTLEEAMDLSLRQTTE